MIDIRMAKDMLRSAGENMLRLADTISEHGDSLKDHEKALVRAAVMPAVQERLDFALICYLTGKEVQVDLSDLTI